ncbi:MAG: hypothetical protein M3498_05445 [Deinococcota bacterium]|nr:hypothetical protein [Deinococcota bacterium]
MKPGSWPWLVRHDLRLGWRELAARWSPRLVLALAGGLLLLVHLGLWYVLRDLRGSFELSGEGYTAVLWLLTGGLALAFTLALSLSMNRSLVALFDRGDLDLLLSSPLPSRTVLASRALGVALTVLLPFGLLAVPLASAGLMLGLPQLLGLYPVVLVLALTTTSLGLLVTLLLVRLFGARVARTVTQILGSLVGAGLMLGYYLALLSDWRPLANPEALAGLLAPGAPLGPDSPLWWPARAALAEPLPLALALGSSLGLFWLTVALTHRRFVTGTQEALSVRRRPEGGGGRLVFRGGLTRVALLKEWRLILRDPYLISQTLLQVLYLIPLAVFLFRGEGGFTGLSPVGLGVVVVALAGTLAGSLARICVSGEEAPELLAASPAESGRLRWLKLGAALLPIWLLCLPLLLTLALRGTPGWFWALLGFVGMTLSVGVINVWSARTVPRADLFKSKGNKDRDVVMMILEGVVLWSWLGATWGLALGAWWGWLALALGLFLPGLAYGRYRQRGTGLAY